MVETKHQRKLGWPFRPEISERTTKENGEDMVSQIKAKMNYKYYVMGRLACSFIHNLA